MNPSTYIPIIVMWIIIIYVLLSNRKAVIARQIIKKRKTEGNTEMKELAMRFIDKECVISSFDGNHQYEGIIKEPITAVFQTAYYRLCVCASGSFN